MQVGSTPSPQMQGAGEGGAELRAAKLAKGQQEAEGKAAMELLKSAEIPPQSANPAVGGNINIKV
ncbi:hypothetical protein HR060_00260 [Catenovulum sp. SM1970]|uniref:hypothetical protein n=1 Tax=Marinifaba aquimaris TaxID=2741323 RepID=UPI0015736998|nr:hypothetical protein [Marinifaba aquimaris]NTS75281.1 hypothetical protein [Marinifaba aquimaris]